MSTDFPYLCCPAGPGCRGLSLGLGASLLWAAKLAAAQKWAQKGWVAASPASGVPPEPSKFLLFYKEHEFSLSIMQFAFYVTKRVKSYQEVRFIPWPVLLSSWSISPGTRVMGTISGQEHRPVLWVHSPPQVRV